MKKVKFIALITLLICLLIVIPTSFAAGNDTAIAVSDDNQDYIFSATHNDVLRVSEQYYNASVENDTGDGSIEHPYKEFKSYRIQSDSIIHMADGEYNLDKITYPNNLTIIGENVEKTIINFRGTGFYVANSLTLKNVTLVNLGINDDYNTIINANNVIFKNSISSAIASDLSTTKIYLDNCTFFNDTASNGGAVYLLYCSQFIIKNSQIINCTSTFGGLITSLRSNATLINVTARNNKVKYDGGVLYAMYGDLAIYNSTFDNNSAKNGGALYIDTMDYLMVYNNNFTNNKASHTAGAVYSTLNKISILNETLNNSFSNNSACYEDDVFESQYINLTVGSIDYILINSNITFNGTIPSRYNLTEVTPVKDQGSNGNCWAFAAISSLESCILKATGEIYDLSESNMKNLMALFSDYGWKMTPNTGGYDKMGYGYLVSWLGPVNESDDPYIIGTVLSPVMESIFHIQNVLFLNRNNFTDNDAIKKAILMYGGVATSMNWTSSYLSGSSYYYNGNKAANHAVTIVGWDDNYSKTKFKNTPPGDGAWIIKNSWGTGSGEEGYYYVSYYDTVMAKPGKLEGNYVFVFNESMKYDKNYQYDIPGKTDYFLNFTSTVWYKNSFISTDNEYLSAVSTYFMKETDWEVSIYVNDVLKHVQSGHSPNSYSTIELSQFIPLAIGDEFEIIFKITVEGDAGVPISEAVSLNHEMYHENISFISYDGENWADLYDLPWSYPSHTYASQVACIKAFTIFNPLSTTINLTVDDPYNPCLVEAVVLNKYGNPVMYGNVTLNIEGKDYVVEIVNGVAGIYHVFENMGNQQIKAAFEKVGFVNSSSKINVTIYKGEVEISLNITVGILDAEINITLSKPINETVQVDVNRTVYEVNLTNGVGTLVLTDLYYGKYDVTAYIITDVYYCENATASFNTNYLNTYIDAVDVDAYYNENFTYSIRLHDRKNIPIDGKTIVFTIGDEIKESITDADGIATVMFSLSPGNYMINITCPQEGKCLESEDCKNISIRTTFELPAYSTYTYNSNYIVSLVDSNGNKLNNADVVVYINDVAYTLKTDANGVLNYNILLSPGSYKIAVKNSPTGEVKSQDIKVVKRITENRAVTMYYGAGKYYKVKVFDDNGNPAKGVRVTFTISNKKYTRTTNNNGYASFKISLKPAKYTITAEYKGFKVSNRITVKSTIITKNIAVKKGKTIKFTAKLLNKNGKILKNKKVTFKFKGKTYKIKTNKKGKAILKITKKYKKGKYTIVTSYGKLKIKNIIRIK